MIRGAEPSQLDPFAVLNLLCVRVPPLDGDVAVCVCVDEHVEGAVTGELGEEGDGGGDLAEDGGDFGLDLGFGLVFFGEEGGCGGCGRGVFLLLLLLLFGGGRRIGGVDVGGSLGFGFGRRC